MSSLPAAECGFVRVPRSYLELPISPGAKVVLLHLCAAANEAGESWYGYDDIGRMIGRSKASITTYVQELIDTGLIDAIEQKMANGFNYRRRLRLRQWRDLLAYWKSLTTNKKSRNSKGMSNATETETREISVTRTSVPEVCSNDSVEAGVNRKVVHQEPESAVEAAASVASQHGSKAVSGQDKTKDQQSAKPRISVSNPAECRVQPAECMDPTGPNKKHQTKTLGASAPVDWSKDDELEWRQFRPDENAPMGSANGPVPAHLVSKLVAQHRQLEHSMAFLSRPQAENLARSRLREFAQRKRLSVTLDGLEKASLSLAEMCDCPALFDRAMDLLEAVWKPHWRYLPTPGQIHMTLAEELSRDEDIRAKRARLRRIEMRLTIARIHSAKQSLRTGP